MFTLVGIAGEDDLDAPDLNAPTVPKTGPEQPAGNGNGRLNRGQRYATPPRPYRGRTSGFSPSALSNLQPEASAALCRQMLAEVASIASTDEAATWARQTLGAKNRLAAADAASVEEAFEARLAALATPDRQATELSPSTTQAAKAAEPAPVTTNRRKPPSNTKAKTVNRAIDKSTLALPEPRRLRDRDHVRYVAKQACLICGRRPSDSHHLRFAQSRALGRKVSDEFTVPLCRGHHRELHRCGDEAAWWRKAEIDPIIAARALWLETHPLPVAANNVAFTGGNSPILLASDQPDAVRDRGADKPGPNSETKPLAAAGAQ